MKISPVAAISLAVQFAIFGLLGPVESLISYLIGAASGLSVGMLAYRAYGRRIEEWEHRNWKNYR